MNFTNMYLGILIILHMVLGTVECIPISSAKLEDVLSSLVKHGEHKASEPMTEMSEHHQREILDQ